MSSLYLRGRSVWIGFTDPSTGARQDKPTGFRLDKVERKNGRVVFPKYIRDFQRQFDAALALGRFGLVERPTKPVKLTEAYDLFLQTRGSLRKPATIQNDRLAIRKLVEIVGNRRLHEYDEELLFKWRNGMIEMEGEQNTAKYLRHLSTLFNWAVDKGYIKKTPISREVKLNPTPPLPVSYSPEEVSRVFELLFQSDPALADQLMFLLLTGFRSGESCELTWDRIDFERRVIKHWNEKAKRWEMYPMDETLEQFLSGIARTYQPHVFKYRNTSTLSHYLKDKALRPLGLNEKLNVHSLKKTFVSGLIEAGLSEAETHKLSHHKSFQTTLSYYTRFRIGHLREALAKSRRPDNKILPLRRA